MSGYDLTGLSLCLVEDARSGWRLSRCPEVVRPGEKLSQFDEVLVLAEAEQQPELK